MPPSNSLAEQKALRQRLDQAHAEAAQPLSRDAVAEIVRGMLTTLSGDVSVEDIRLYKELEGLAKYIQDARNEIAAIRPSDIKDQHIQSATDELDAVIGATEKATFEIFDACDVISASAGNLHGDEAAKLNDAVTRIFEACNFQDITGQRIAKVVKALKAIEVKVDQLLSAFGDDVRQFQAAAPANDEEITAADANPEAKLLHGPQLPGNAIDQDEIDRLLASFD